MAGKTKPYEGKLLATTISTPSQNQQGVKSRFCVPSWWHTKSTFARSTRIRILSEQASGFMGMIGGFRWGRVGLALLIKVMLRHGYSNVIF